MPYCFCTFISTLKWIITPLNYSFVSHGGCIRELFVQSAMETNPDVGFSIMLHTTKRRCLVFFRILQFRAISPYISQAATARDSQHIDYGSDICPLVLCVLVCTRCVYSSQTLPEGSKSFKAHHVYTLH